MKVLLKQEKTLLAAILFAALFLRLGAAYYGILARGEQFLFSFDDAAGYVKIAENLAAGRGFVIDHLDGAIFPETGRTPGYPALIAVSLTLFESVMPVVALQIVLGSMLPLLGYMLAARIFAHRTIAALTGFFLAAEPLMVIITPLLLTETLFITLFWGGLLLLLGTADARDQEKNRARRLALSGLAIGTAALVRPVIAYAVPIFIIFIAYETTRKKPIPWKKTFMASCIFFAAFSLVAIPWMIRNRRITGSYGLTSLSGTVGYFYTGVSVVSIATGVPYPDVRRELRQRAVDDLGPDGPRDPKNLPYFKQKTREIIMRYPKEFAQSTILGTFHFFTHDGYYDTFQRTGLVAKAPPGASQISLIARGQFRALARLARQYLAWPWILFIASRLAWIALFIFSVIGFFASWRRGPPRRPMLALVFFLIAAFALATSAVALGIHGRLRMPLNAFIIPLALTGFFSLTRKIKSVRMKTP